MSFNDLKLISLANQVGAAIKLAISKDERLSHIQDQLASLKEKRRQCSFSPESAVEVYWGALRSGQPKTYYEAETVALCSDLEYVVTTHNINLLSNEIEKTKKEIVQETLKQSKILSLSPKEKKRLFQILEIKNKKNILTSIFSSLEADFEQTDLPAVAAKKYTIRIQLEPPEEEFNPDPEVLDLFAEDQANWEANGDGKRGNGGGLKAQMAAAGMVQAGVKTVKMYASVKAEAKEEKSEDEDEEVEP